MNFASMLFLLVFLLLHLLSQTLIPSPRGKNIALGLSALVFYVWVGPLYATVLLALILLTWLLAKQIGAAADQTARKAMLALGVAAPLAVMIPLKYIGLLLGTVRALFGVPQILPEALVPIGIGVYSLQLIGYLVDVYRGEIAPEQSLPRFALFGGQFYGCVCGPVLRYGDFAPSLDTRKTELQGVSRGATRICLGVAKRYLLADSLATLVDTLLSRTSDGLAGVPVTGLWVGVILSALRMYLTFSAYADLAVGMGLVAGLPIPENFDCPLCSLSMTSFLSKWFVSVGDFFRDYVIRPITRGNRRLLLGALAGYGLMGLWYGGSWCYVLWGLFAGLMIFLEKRYFSRLPAPASALIGLAEIFLSFTLLSFTTLPRLGIALRGLVGLGGNGFFRAEAFSGLHGTWPLILVSVCAALPLGNLVHNLWRRRFRNSLGMLTAASVWEAAWPLALLLVTAIWLLRGGDSPFLTF